MTTSQIRSLFLVFFCFARLPVGAQESGNEPQYRVEVDAPKKTAWLGQRIPFFVQLKAKGPFVGAAGFSVPQVPKVIVAKIGNPVVSSDEIDGETWNVQSHEFAVFSQQSGKITIPSFQVRFSSRDGFTGPQIDHVAEVPSFEVEVNSPPGFDGKSFLVTTSNIEIEQSWQPDLETAQQGSIIQRVITQEAEDLSGMALAPPPESTPSGVRVYAGKPEVTDRTERGEFSGQRRDTLKYYLEKPGQQDLPAFKYVWWNPHEESFASNTLPGITLNVESVQKATAPTEIKANQSSWGFWLIFSVGITWVVIWRRQQLGSIYRNVRDIIAPPEQRLASKLIKACRRNDAMTAEQLLYRLPHLASPPGETTPALKQAILDLHKHIYGESCKPSDWDGQKLEHAIRQQPNRPSGTEPGKQSALPILNP